MPCFHIGRNLELPDRYQPEQPLPHLLSCPTCHGKQDTGDVVVTIVSIAGLRYIGKPQVAYSATKADTLQFTKTIASIYADGKIQLNTVVPGLIYTHYTRALAQRYAPGGDEEAYIKKRDAQVPIGRTGDVWDVAKAALFLVSNQASYITGQNIEVDGGTTASTGRV